MLVVTRGQGDRTDAAGRVCEAVRRQVVYLRIVDRGEDIGRWGWATPRVRLARHRQAVSEPVDAGWDARVGDRTWVHGINKLEFALTIRYSRI